MTPVAPLGASRAIEAYTAAGRDSAPVADGFGAALQRAAQGVVDVGHAADLQAASAIAGTGNLTEVVAAVSRADLALQATSAIRDRMVQAYQDIMRIPI
jgi:flagellar hook-basal body complex protein FliE